MSSITFSGLASGLDTGSIIDALVKAAHVPVDRLETRKTTLDSQLSTLSNLSSRLSNLRSSALSLDTLSEFRSYTASTSDDTKLTGTASSTAVEGSYSVTVKTLARAQRSYSLSVADHDELNQVGTGTLGIRVGTGDFTYINIDEATMSLDSVAQAINSSGAGVLASVVKLSDSDYRLMITGEQTGIDSAITFTDTGTLETKLGLEVSTPAQTAADAWVQMDGQDYYRDTNQMSDVIPGVTLNLLASSDPDPITITVAPDPDAVVKKVQALVTAYNSVMDLFKKEFTYSGEVEADSLMGDSAVHQIKSRLQSVIGARVEAVSGDYNALSRIGITTNRDGSLSLDSTKLKNALADDPQAVTDLITYNDHNSSTANDGIAVRLVDALDQILRSSDGLLTARQNGIRRSMSNLDERIESMERSLDTYEAGLRKQFTSLETLISSLQTQGNSLTKSLG